MSTTPMSADEIEALHTSVRDLMSKIVSYSDTCPASKFQPLSQNPSTFFQLKYHVYGVIGVFNRVFDAIAFQNLGAADARKLLNDFKSMTDKVNGLPPSTKKQVEEIQIGLGRLYPDIIAPTNMLQTSNKRSSPDSLTPMEPPKNKVKR